MGVPVSKLKSSSQSVTLIVEKNRDRIPSKLEQDDLCNVKLVESRITFKEKDIEPPLDEEISKRQLTQPEVTAPCAAASDESSQLKFIDDNEVSESDSFRKEADNDNDSGNASISSDSSQHEDGYEFDNDALEPIRLRRRPPAFNFYSTLTNRLSTTSFVKRYSAQSVLSQIEQSSLRKLISKLQPGDLIEIRCLCNCLKGGQLRASLNHRQRFRRTLQRQSFHQLPLSSTTTSKRSSLNLSSVFRRSCISGSASELPNVSPVDSRNLLSPGSAFTNSEQCTEQFHYVFVQRVEPRSDTTDSADTELTSNVWCFHVRPYQRVALLEDDRHLGVIKHESLDAIVSQFLGEIEERHWQFGRGIKQPKLSVYYQIRNQEKLSESILKLTLNAKPDTERAMELLEDVKDSYVRYHRTLCNSEHYATLWKYGIGWSTWASGRADILRALAQFVASFSQLSSSSSMQLQGGECLHEQTNLIVHCFGLHGSRLEDSIREWIHSQVVIARTNAPIAPLETSPFIQSSDTLPVAEKRDRLHCHPMTTTTDNEEDNLSNKLSTSSIEESIQKKVEPEAAASTIKLGAEVTGGTTASYVLVAQVVVDGQETYQ